MSSTFYPTQNDCDSDQLCIAYRRQAPPGEWAGIWSRSPCQNCKRGREREERLALERREENTVCPRCGWMAEHSKFTRPSKRRDNAVARYGVCYACALETGKVRKSRHDSSKKRGPAPAWGKDYYRHKWVEGRFGRGLPLDQVRPVREEPAEWEGHGEEDFWNEED